MEQSQAITFCCFFLFQKLIEANRAELVDNFSWFWFDLRVNAWIESDLKSCGDVIVCFLFDE